MGFVHPSGLVQSRTDCFESFQDSPKGIYDSPLFIPSELTMLGVEVQCYDSRFSITLFRDVKARLLRSVAVTVAVKQTHDIRIPFDLAGIAQIPQSRHAVFVFPGFTVELRQCY